MDWLRKLPGYKRTPYGFEWRLLRMLPRILLAGTVLPVFLSGLARYFFKQGTAAEIERHILMFDYAMIGLAVVIWTAVVTLALGCVIVWIMKGPAYVADGFDVSHSDQPKK